MKSSLRSVGTIDEFSRGVLRALDARYPLHNFPQVQGGNTDSAEMGRDGDLLGSVTRPQPRIISVEEARKLLDMEPFDGD